jgi:hypothetical protein
VFCPETSLRVADRPVITFVIGDLARTMEDEKARS